eukprot:10580-Heterococcus_DN1.PRE.2
MPLPQDRSSTTEEPCCCSNTLKNDATSSNSCYSTSANQSVSVVPDQCCGSRAVRSVVTGQGEAGVRHCCAR